MSPQELGLWLIAIFSISLVIEIVGGIHSLSRQTFKDASFALLNMFVQALFAGPLVGAAIGFALAGAFPGSAGALASVPFWYIFPAWLIAEEFAHYWVHRWAHEWPWLWKFHRTHHSAPQLNVMVIYRFNIFWNLMTPQTWFGAAAVYLGKPELLVGGAMVTFIVNLFTHTAYRWDLALRKLPGMNPVLNVVEKVITLPDTHHAHHGMGRGAYLKGNYAVTFFIFDVMLGTARIPRARQERFGLPGKLDWKEELFWPVVRTPQKTP